MRFFQQFLREEANVFISILKKMLSAKKAAGRHLWSSNIISPAQNSKSSRLDIMLCLISLFFVCVCQHLF